MLLRFRFENHLSFRAEQELNLVASSLSDHEESLITLEGLHRKVLPFAIVYGANASGKSNLVGALRFMRTAVLRSHTAGKPDGGVPRAPFRLCNDPSGSPSAFELDFVLDGERLTYGFEVDDNAFTSEWLFSFPRQKRRVLFERIGQEFSFSRHLKGRNLVISELTRPNSLYVSSAAQNDHPFLTKLYGYFRDIKMYTDVYSPEESTGHGLVEDRVDQRMIEFLRSIGTGVVSHRKAEMHAPDQAPAIQDALKRALSETGIDVRIEVKSFESGIEFGHEADGEDVIFLPMDAESAGTRRLALMLGAIFSAIDSGGLVLVDEIDASLHTKACEAIVALFASKKVNAKGAQLIATTHDTNLLNSDFIRRDEVWLCEKSRVGESVLFPLSDIKVRKADNLERGYLQGRFGAVPFSSRGIKQVEDNLA